MDRPPSPPLAVFCLKCGSKYPADYVNRLHRMVQRHLALPHTFHCMTEDPRGLDEDIVIHPLPVPDLGGCWNKLWLFSAKLTPLPTTVLYLDLDIVLVDCIDVLAGCLPGANFVGQPDWNRRLFWQINSSVMRFTAGAHTEVLGTFLREVSSRRLIRRVEWDGTTRSRDKTVYWRGWRRFGSDQEWITAQLRQRLPLRQLVFPQGWIVSFKRDARRSIPPGAQIIVFHGSPKPHEVDATYVRSHWR